MKLTTVAAIVVYNKRVEDSITCKKILDECYESVEILIVDNSVSDFGNKEYCYSKNIGYISMNGNAGLSKAYNAAIDASKGKDVIILFDDDTDVTRDYFEKLNNALNTYQDVDIFAPIIYGQDGVIYSPNEYGFLRNYFIKSPDQPISPEKFNAIASCLAIRMRVFSDYRFNEKLFVDQVDQNFFYDQRKRSAKFKKLDVRIHQNFYQRGEKLTPEAGWKRLRLRIVDIMRQTRLIGGIKIRLMGFVKCCGLGMQIGKKSNSLILPLKAFTLALACTVFDR